MPRAERSERLLHPHSADPYSHSAAALLLRARREAGEPLQLAALDIDSTLTGGSEPANEVRDGLETLGFVVSFVTSRTEEMIMSSGSFERSSRAGFRRPPPKLDTKGEQHVYVPPEEQVAAGLLDGEVIAGSSGTRILVRQEDGAYLPDLDYQSRFGVLSEVWRQTALELVQWTQSVGCRAEPAPIETPQLYADGRSDVYPPDYRVQVNFPSEDDKAQFVAAIGRARGQGLHGARSARLTDDSNPEKDRYKMFLTPRHGSKARAVQQIVGQLCRAAGFERGALHILFAGDSFPDLTMGLLGGLGTTGTLFLAGGSRLVPHLLGDADPVFAGEKLSAFRRRITPGRDAGSYLFRLPCRGLGTRHLMVGDEIFPGKQAVESVAQYVRVMRQQSNA